MIMDFMLASLFPPGVRFGALGGRTHHPSTASFSRVLRYRIFGRVHRGTDAIAPKGQHESLLDYS
ncbi:MAG: hypothetical protein ACK462_17885, partial [Planctomyces sp.]